jgi:hypothetical protein
MVDQKAKLRIHEAALSKKRTEQKIQRDREIQQQAIKREQRRCFWTKPIGHKYERHERNDEHVWGYEEMCAGCKKTRTQLTTLQASQAHSVAYPPKDDFIWQSITENVRLPKT